MTEIKGKVRMDQLPRKTDVSDALALDWQTVSFRYGKSVLAQTIDADPKTINRAITGETLPELHKALASLLLDPAALQRTMALYGVRVVLVRAQAANDLSTASSLTDLAGALIRALEDGVRDPCETVAIAALIAPIMPKLEAIAAEARRIEGVAA